MNELILWVVFVTSGSCGTYQGTRISTIYSSPKIYTTEISAWADAVSVYSDYPCADIKVKRYIAREQALSNLDAKEKGE